MALNMFSNISVAGPCWVVVDLPPLLRILLLLAEYLRRARRRGASCTRGRILWRAKTESTADQSCRTACYCHRITSSVEAEDSTAGQNKEPCNFQRTMWTLGVAEEDGSRASCHCHVTMLDRLLPNIGGAFSEQRRQRRWSNCSWQENHVQEKDDGSHDWSEQSCSGSIDDVSESQDVSCHDQNSVCTSDADSDAHCRTTLRAGTLTASTAWLKKYLPRPADKNSTVAWSSRQLASSSSSSDDDDMSSSITELDSSIAEQLDSNDDGDMDDCESVSCSTITTEHELLLRQRDVGEDIAVSVAREQTTTETTHNNGDTPWWLVPGFRFAPTDQEIVQHYLKLKVLNIALPRRHPVAEGHNVYALDADEIPLDGRNGDKERLGFFFARKEDKGTYSNGCYHATPEGYWRIRGRPARVRQSGRTIAFKTPMDFYRGRPPHGCRTPWSMLEYALNAVDWRNDDLRNTTQPWMNSYVVCKVRKRERQCVSDGRAEKFCRGLLPRRPFFKKVSPRSFRLEKVVDGAPPALKEEEAATRQDGGETGVRGKRVRPNMF